MKTLSNKHTPGPWTWESDPANPNLKPGSIVALNDPRGVKEIPIGQVYGFGEEAVANARLIAAAPDLLKQLGGALFVLENYGVHECQVKNIRAAITKATGEA